MSVHVICITLWVLVANSVLSELCVLLGGCGLDPSERSIPYRSLGLEVIYILVLPFYRRNQQSWDQSDSVGRCLCQDKLVSDIQARVFPTVPYHSLEALSRVCVYLISLPTV